MAKKNTEVKVIPVANLDENSIYQGVMFIAASELKPSHIPVPADCDLAIGQYKWDLTGQTFIPLLNRNTKARG